MTFFSIAAKSVAIFAATISFSQHTWACPSPAAYRSVVLNDRPETVPLGAIAIQVKVLDALMSDSKKIIGLRGIAVDESRKISAGTMVIVKSRLGSMCNTWFEQWSSTHDIDKFGKLTGYIIGFPKIQKDTTISLRPLLYQTSAYRKSYDRFSEPRELEIDTSDKKAIWQPIIVDAKSMGQNSIQDPSHPSKPLAISPKMLKRVQHDE